MSTQHPDNVTTPFFSDSEVVAGEAEVKEAYYVFSQLGCTEQMWDSEGKEADNQVVEKLLSRYHDFFMKNILGQDLFLTYRVPNPSVQKEQGKILLETLHIIPRAFDVAKAVGIDVAPIFEVILPMTKNAVEIDAIKTYYERIVIGQKNAKIAPNKTVKEWVGDFKPEEINVIPLFEDYDAFFEAPRILEDYLKGKKQEYQRVFLARSDPALNYGSTSAVLMAKILLSKLHDLEEKLSVDIYPIFGVGSAPFRGNFRPANVNNCGEEYPSVQTFTAQSSFKYDNHPRDVVNAIDMINLSKRSAPLPVDEKKSVFLVDKITHEYQRQIMKVSDIINGVSNYIPSRRSRKLHVGLFGYSRSVKGVKLPRAIKFCGAFYSIGLPPELLGLSALNEKEFDTLHELYVKMDEDIMDSIKFLNMNVVSQLPRDIKDGVKKVLQHYDYEENEEYVKATSKIYSDLVKGNTAMLSEEVRNAAWIRKFLG